jgi:hypothetical protein
MQPINATRGVPTPDRALGNELERDPARRPVPGHGDGWPEEWTDPAGPDEDDDADENEEATGWWRNLVNTPVAEPVRWVEHSPKTPPWMDAATAPFSELDADLLDTIEAPLDILATRCTCCDELEQRMRELVSLCSGLSEPQARTLHARLVADPVDPSDAVAVALARLAAPLRARLHTILSGQERIASGEVTAAAAPRRPSWPPRR